LNRRDVMAVTFTKHVLPEEVGWHLATGWRVIDGEYKTEDGKWIIQKESTAAGHSEKQMDDLIELVRRS